jgi:hypothetical protein
MKRKLKGITRRAALFVSLAALSAVVASQNGIPGKLSGRWATPDGTSSQAISATIDPATSRGTLMVYSNLGPCTIRDAAITASMEADKLVLKVDPSYTNPCRSEVLVELTKKPGTEDYEGELRQQSGREGARQPQTLKVKMSP